MELGAGRGEDEDRLDQQRQVLAAVRVPVGLADRLRPRAGGDPAHQERRHVEALPHRRGRRAPRRRPWCRSRSRPCRNYDPDRWAGPRGWVACSCSPWRAAAGRPSAPSGYALMQMNLCLSGLAGCYGKTAYPAVVEEAMARIRAGAPGRGHDQRGLPGRRRADRPPDRLPRALLDGPLPRRAPPVRPAGRPRALRRRRAHQGAIERTDNQDFKAQAGLERRRWLCVTTRARRRRLHRAPEHPRGRSRWPATRPSAPSSRRSSPAARPPAPSSSAATSTAAAPAPRAAPGPAPTASAGQAPGLQHVYGSRTLRSPSARGACRPRTPTTTSCWSAPGSRRPASSLCLEGGQPGLRPRWLPGRARRRCRGVPQAGHRAQLVRPGPPETAR